MVSINRHDQVPIVINCDKKMKFELKKESVLFFPTITLCSLIGQCSVQGHGMLASPGYRRYYALSQGATEGSAAGVPPTEYCPHCISAKVSCDSCKQV